MRLAITVLAVASIAGTVRAEDTTKRSAELRVLDLFVGTWDIKTTVKPTGGEATTNDDVSIRSWSKGGKFVIFDDPNEDELVMPITYDPASKSYPGVMMIGSGQGRVTGTWDEDTQTMHFLIENANRTTYKGTHRFIRDGYAEASGKITNPAGDVLLELSWNQTRRAQETNAEEVIKAHVNAFGGLEALDKIKTIKRTGPCSAETFPDGHFQGTSHQATVVGRKAYQKADMGEFHFSIKWNGTESWLEETGSAGSADEEANRGDVTYVNAAVSISPLVTAWQQYGTSAIKVLPEETHDGQTYLVLQTMGNVKFFLDKQSHLLARRTIAEEDDVVLSFGNYARHKGVQLPGTMDVEFPDEGGKTVFHFTYDKTEINVELDDALFDKP
jgi:hypothetical protein